MRNPRPLHIFKILVLSVLTASASHAQTATDNWSGQWTGTTKSPNSGNELLIQLNIAGEEGKWRYVPPTGARGSSPCLGREFPVSVKSVAPSKVTLHVDGPRVIAGCPSFSLALTGTDGQTLTGAFGDGRAVTLKKQ